MAAQKALRFKETIHPRITAVTSVKDRSGKIISWTFGCLSCRTFDTFMPHQYRVAVGRTRTHQCRKAGK